jgi:hypothetical protein
VLIQCRHERRVSTVHGHRCVYRQVEVIHPSGGHRKEGYDIDNLIMHAHVPFSSVSSLQRGRSPDCYYCSSLLSVTLLMLSTLALSLSLSLMTCTFPPCYLASAGFQKSSRIQKVESYTSPHTSKSSVQSDTLPHQPHTHPRLTSQLTHSTSQHKHVRYLLLLQPSGRLGVFPSESYRLLQEAASQGSRLVGMLHGQGHHLGA